MNSALGGLHASQRFGVLLKSDVSSLSVYYYGLVNLPPISTKALLTMFSAISTLRWRRDTYNGRGTATSESNAFA